ncbi:MAG: UDP-3-O-(3-hydroxymyristoyl)glucosamine N-acyltransferase [Gammaproteobacteria bacterium]|nr:UDP-3-O-(3-hydroxymyristoyl)glucosamine N-acyltransferase [Gammaproteobacteria bacterium]
MTLTLGDIANCLGLELRGSDATEIEGIASLDGAARGQLTFLFNSAWRDRLAGTQASAVVLREADAGACPVACLISERPRLEWARVASLFDQTPPPDGRIHGSASVAPDASLGEGVSVGAGAVIESGAILGGGVSIGSGCHIGARCELGAGTRLFPNVTLYHDVRIGSNCIVHAGAVLGADGFGFEFDPDAASLAKIPQVYGVQIGDDVEIGAGTTIDRGALNDTRIGDGVKLDNQVQVGHGTVIGAHTAISGCTAIAGSSRIGSYCLIGGAVGIIDNIEITDRVEVTAMSLVSQSITTSGRYSSGTGLLPSRIWKRSVVGFSRLDGILKRLRKLEGK